jgi:hypothetical protein
LARLEGGSAINSDSSSDTTGASCCCALSPAPKIEDGVSGIGEKIVRGVNGTRLGGANRLNVGMFGSGALRKGVSGAAAATEAPKSKAG